MLENTVQYLKKFSNIYYIITDAEKLSFLNHQLGIVTCRTTAHHFPNPSPFLFEVKRVLKPGGKLLLIDNITAESDRLDAFVNKLERMRNYSHFRSWKRSE